MNDPFEALATPVEPLDPRPDFARELRARLVAALAPTIDLPERNITMSTTTPSNAPSPVPAATRATALVPYVCVRDGAAALAWYVDVFGATEVLRVVGDDGRIGHAELRIGEVAIYLSDEYPDLGVVAPPTLGGTAITLHLTVDAVDAVYARAVAAGATPQGEPADQPHGARHGTLIDPHGHRWMLSQQIEQVDVGQYAARADGSGFTVTGGPAPAGAIWAAMNYADAPAGIAFLTDVLGFRTELVVPDDADPAIIHHSQLTWPGGGTLQAGSANRPGNVYSQRPTGAESLYLVTPDPHAVWARCQAAGVEVVQEPMTPDYAPDTMVFSVRDPEGNIFSVGSYSGEG